MSKIYKTSPKIYAWSTNSYLEKNLIKVGYTERDVKKRVAEQIKLPETKHILLVEKAVTHSGHVFTDKEVHRELKRLGIQHMSGEWFYTDVPHIRQAIENVRNYSYSGAPGWSKTDDFFENLDNFGRGLESAAKFFAVLGGIKTRRRRRKKWF